MSSVRRARVSHYAYLLSLEHLVADRHLELLHVGVERHKVAVVLYAHVIAVGGREARPDDLSAVRRVDGRSLVVRDIDSEVEIIRTVKIASAVAGGYVLRRVTRPDERSGRDRLRSLLDAADDHTLYRRYIRADRHLASRDLFSVRVIAYLVRHDSRTVRALAHDLVVARVSLLVVYISRLKAKGLVHGLGTQESVGKREIVLRSRLTYHAEIDVRVDYVSDSRRIADRVVLRRKSRKRGDTRNIISIRVIIDGSGRRARCGERGDLIRHLRVILDDRVDKTVNLLKRHQRRPEARLLLDPYMIVYPDVAVSVVTGLKYIVLDIAYKPLKRLAVSVRADHTVVHIQHIRVLEIPVDRHGERLVHIVICKILRLTDVNDAERDASRQRIPLSRRLGKLRLKQSDSSPDRRHGRNTADRFPVDKNLNRRVITHDAAYIDRDRRGHYSDQRVPEHPPEHPDGAVLFFRHFNISVLNLFFILSISDYPRGWQIQPFLF